MTDLDSKLILKYQRCEASPQEEEQVLDYLEQSEEHRREMDRANFLFCAALLNGRPRKARTLRSRWYWGMAAALASLLIGTILFISKKTEICAPQTPSCVTIEVPEGSKTRITLPDGSGVWLNSGSKLSYQEKFNREVSLSGEACFEVAANENHPFQVSAGELNLIVTGTVFNVRAYKDEPRIETTLASGKLRIENGLGEQIFLLRPGQNVSCDVNGEDIVSTNVDAWELLLDIYGQVTISDVSLTELCGILEHIYNVSIKVRSDDGTAVTFSFTKDTPIETILSRLETVSQRTLELQ